MVQAVDGAFLKDLLEEHFAQGGRQLVNQTGNAKVVVADNGFFGIEYLADFQRNLCFLKGLGKLFDARNDGADTYDHAGIEFAAQRVHNRTRQLFDVLAVDAALDFLDQHDVLFTDVENKILLFVRKEILDDVKCRDVVGGNDPHQQYHTVDIGVKVQLARLDINIAWQDVFQNDIFDEVVAVIFFIVVLLDACKGNSKNVAEFCRCFIGALYKYCVVRLCAGTERFVGVTIAHKDIGILVEIQHQILVGLADSCQVTARNSDRIAVYNTDDPIDRLPHLMNDSLKQSVGHIQIPSSIRIGQYPY